MPAHDLLGPGKHVLGLGQAIIGLHVVDHGVVKSQEGKVQLGDDKVLIVARIANERNLLAIARDIEFVRRAGTFKQELGQASVDRAIVEMWTAPGPNP